MPTCSVSASCRVQQCTEKALGVRNISSEAYYAKKKHGRRGKKGRAVLQQMNHTRCQDNLIEALKTKRRCLNIRSE